MLDNLGSMDFGQIVVLLLIAVVVGWLAGVITRGGGFGQMGAVPPWLQVNQGARVEFEA